VEDESGLIVLVSGWNWYTGADARGVRASQFDLQTVATHELGHALGLGHSTEPTSVMYGSLMGGVAHRTLTRQDLAVPDEDDGGASGLHAAAGYALAWGDGG